MVFAIRYVPFSIINVWFLRCTLSWLFRSGVCRSTWTLLSCLTRHISLSPLHSISLLLLLATLPSSFPLGCHRRSCLPCLAFLSISSNYSAWQQVQVCAVEAGPCHLPAQRHASIQLIWRQCFGCHDTWYNPLRTPLVWLHGRPW